jgi:hypothetical protein
MFKKIFKRLRRKKKMGPKEFRYDGHDIYGDIVSNKPGPDRLARIFANIDGPSVQKWHHYIPIYEDVFGRYVNTPVRFLEIGVHKGGSLKMWRQYFGEDATIFGIDIDEKCKKLDGVDGKVRIGSQDDEIFLKNVVEEMGGVDIVLDDGSHQMRHIRASFKALFPKLSDSGVYLVEDLHAAYWPRFGGGYKNVNNFFNFVLEVTHDMHRWYHKFGIRYSGITESCASIHIFDSIVVFKKDNVTRSRQSTVPRVLER